MLFRLFAVLCTVPLLLSADVVDDALNAEKAWADKVFRSEVRATWLDAHHFWYRIQTGPKQHEYVLIDAEKGTRKTAPDREGIGLSADVKIRASESKEALHASTPGPATTIRFKNRMKAPVKMFWIDPEGALKQYATVPSEGDFRQNTFAGHVWLVKDDLNRPVSVVTARNEDLDVEIDGMSSVMKDIVTPKAVERGVKSPDGRWRAYVEKGKIMVKGLNDPQSRHLKTTLETATPFQGGLSWAPDSSCFVVSAAAPVDKRKITLMESSPKGQLQPQIKRLDYVKPGDPLPQPYPVIFRLTEEDRGYEYKKVKSDLFANQFSRKERLDIHWALDGQEFYFDFNQRGHQRYCVIGVNAVTGEARLVVEESTQTFIDYTHKTWRHWLDKTHELLWMSERDGWCHLWLYDVKTGQVKQQVTRGEWVVREVLRVDDKKREVWFKASGLRKGEDPYHEHLCRIHLDGSGFIQLTEGDGQHSIEWSPDKKYFIDTWSRIDQPPVIELRHSEDGSLVCPLEKADIAALLATGWKMPEHFVAKGRDGKTDIHGVIFKASSFDASKCYPVVEQVYAGPHGAFAPKEFGVLPRQHQMTEAGFIVVQADGMGTNHRGKAFHDVCWQNLKDAGFPDRMAWIQAAAQTRPWMDLKRVGIYGGSAGGQSAMRALLDHPDFYQVAVADCGCHDNRMDKIWWNEQWLGWPVGKVYTDNSNVEDAAKLQGHLLLIVGEMDANVDPATTYQVVNALQKARKPFEFMPIIGAGHGAAETPFGTRLRMEFLVKYLHP